MEIKRINGKFAKGHIGYWKGKTGEHPQPQSAKDKIRKSQLGEGNSHWVGDRVKYQGVHKWIRSNYGTPQHCKKCGTTKKRMYHWANISGEYMRDIKDFIRVCVPCHKKFFTKKS